MRNLSAPATFSFLISHFLPMFIKENYSLLPHNTFGIDAKCKRFVEYSSEAELQEFLRSRDAEEPLLHIGEGSNLVFTKDFDGTILHSAIKGKQAFAGPDMVMLIVVRSTHQTAYLVWREVGNNLLGGAERVGYMLDVVRAHNTIHNLSIHRQRHKYLRATHHGGPVLVAQGVTQLYGCVDYRLRLHTGQRTEVDDHHVAQLQTQDDQ